jgi:hypothetical protein
MAHQPPDVNREAQLHNSLHQAKATGSFADFSGQGPVMTQCVLCMPTSPSCVYFCVFVSLYTFCRVCRAPGHQCAGT